MSESKPSPSPNSDAEYIARLESNLTELDPELEELCRAQNRDVARAAALRLLVPVLLVSVLVAIGAWTYVKFATTRNEIRQKLNDDPDHAMEKLIRAAGKDGELEGTFSKGMNFDPTKFNSGSFQLPSTQNQRKRQ